MVVFGNLRMRLHDEKKASMTRLAVRPRAGGACKHGSGYPTWQQLVSFSWMQRLLFCLQMGNFPLYSVYRAGKFGELLEGGGGLVGRHITCFHFFVILEVLCHFIGPYQLNR